MSELAIIIMASWAAGLAAVVGGMVAWVRGDKEAETQNELTHGVIALGGGILISAVAFALLPQGMAVLTPVSLGATFCAGGLLFCALDAFLSRRGGTMAQFMAMLMDFLPEALALGAVFGHDRRLGVLLAAFIGAQNLPEGFNSFREIAKVGLKPRAVILSLLAVSVLGPMAACAGYFFLQDHARLTAGIMTFAGGGIMYLIFQDIAPQSKMRRHWTPSLGAVLGFAVGMIGKQLIG
ncbi:MAG: divalent cation transporter [Deltaproteobacteria bacterium HGW-Deltaproteobacteria-22]|jgi:ZIP family zinc transporter|nr:MAG: divalent cation transporter [Deltaproteobacteria bacterium HGW-Deltaproteobacteria-22]